MSRWWLTIRPERSERPGPRPVGGPTEQPLVSAGRSSGPARRRPAPTGRSGVVVPISLGRGPRPRPPVRDLELSLDHNGRTVDTPVGEEFLLRLPENWATGYTWQFTDPVDDNLAVVGSTFEGAAPSRPGSGGHLVMRLRGRRQGSATLRLVLGRLWGGESIDTFEVTVRVVEQGDGPHGSSSR